MPTARVRIVAAALATAHSHKVNSSCTLVKLLCVGNIWEQGKFEDVWTL